MKSKKIFILLSALALSLAACNGGGKSSEPKPGSSDQTPASSQQGGEDVIAVTGITLNKTTLSLEVGKSESLVATVAPSNATNTKVTWESSDPTVATVSTLGKVSALKVGNAKITVKSVSNPDIKAECNLTVAEEGGQYGSLNKPKTVAEILAIAANECKEDGNVTSDVVYVKGIVTKQPTYNAAKGYSQNIYLKDALTDEKDLLVYTANHDATKIPYQNDEVIIHGYLKNYRGTIEIASVDTNYPEVDVVTRGTSTISYTVSHGSINDDAPKSGKNLSEFSFTVTPDADYQVNSVSINGDIVEAQADGSYKGVIKGDVTVLVDIGQAGVEVLNAVMKYEGETSANMTGGNDAALLNLDETLFNVVSDDATGIYAGLNAAKNFRLYNGYNNTEDRTKGTQIVVSSVRATILKIVVTLASSTVSDLADLEVKAGDAVVEGEEGAYEINALSFSIKNVSNAEASSQIHIAQIAISYKMNQEVAATDIALDQDSIEIEAGKHAQLTATLTPANATDVVVWSSSDDEVVTVTQTGRIDAVAEGTAVITAKVSDTILDTCDITVKPAKVINYGSAEAPLTVTEAKAVIDETGTEETKKPVFVKGIVSSNTAFSSFGNFDEVWLQSEDGSEAKAFELYRVKLDSSITETFTAENSLAGREVVATGYGKFFRDTYELTTSSNEPKNPLILSVSKLAATGVELDKDELSLTVGATGTLVASIVPEGAVGTISWASSDIAVATVADGVVTAAGVGTATIYAFIDANGNGAFDEGELNASCEATIVAAGIPATNVALDKSSGTLVVGQTLTLTATVEPSNSTDAVVWTSSNDEVATVADGVVTAVAPGPATITATAGDKSAEYALTVEAITAANVYPGAQVEILGKVVAVGGKNAMIDDGTAGLWTYSASNVTVSVGDFVKATGRTKSYNGGIEVDAAVLTAAEGSVETLTAQPITEDEVAAELAARAANNNYNVSHRKVSLRTGVIGGSGTYLTWEYGDSMMETSISTGGMQVGFAYDVEGYLVNFYKDTKVTPNVTYLCMCITSATKVTVPATDISLDKDTLEIEEGAKATLKATLTPAGASDTVKWLSSDTAVATVDQSGKVTGVAQGSATITAFIDADNDGVVDEAELKAECAVTVNEASGGQQTTLQVATSIAVGDTVYLASNAVSQQYNGPSSTSTIYGLGAAFTDTPSAEGVAFEVVAGNSEGTFAFKIKSGDNANKYLAWSSGNSLKVDSTLDANSSWKVSFDANGNCTIANAADNARIIWWNVSSPRFACYTSKSDGDGYKYVQLWK